MCYFEGLQMRMCKPETKNEFGYKDKTKHPIKLLNKRPLKLRAVKHK